MGLFYCDQFKCRIFWQNSLVLNCYTADTKLDRFITAALLHMCMWGGNNPLQYLRMYVLIHISVKVFEDHSW